MWEPPWEAWPHALLRSGFDEGRGSIFLFSGIIDERGRDFLSQFRVSLERSAPSP
jgi:hypothetical protein